PHADRRNRSGRQEDEAGDREQPPQVLDRSVLPGHDFLPSFSATGSGGMPSPARSAGSRFPGGESLELSGDFSGILWDPRCGPSSLTAPSTARPGSFSGADVPSTSPPRRFAS